MRDRVIGRIPVLECLRAKKRTARRLFLLRDAKGLEAIRAAAGPIPIEECARLDLDNLAKGAIHQGVVLEADPLPRVPLDRWLAGSIPADAVVIILDGIEDPHNFGAIVRSASACAASAVVFGKDRSAPLSSVAMKSAAGAMEYIDLIEVTNLVRAVEALKKSGFWIAGLDADAEQDLWDADLKGRIGLVVGSEGKGVRRLMTKHCDFHLRIPLTGPITSLNASVSAAIALAECVRQRRG
ncbi:MAG: 23S rRNA (guanosine(2251)-2'-O)-methyltransferase RlmB [Candidatus Hydrogenedentes bacterium]|nr:23S rRNA (guanosine(2251)-2'-O)-methyltransferase RlmB [Candidatus Hydrogenedentota bacterium]